MMNKNNVIKLSDYKKHSCKSETQEQWVERIKNIEKEWSIDFDAEIKNNAHTISEKIAVFIWEKQAKQGYSDIKTIIDTVFYICFALILTASLGIFFILLMIGLEKLYLLLRIYI